VDVQQLTKPRPGQQVVPTPQQPTASDPLQQLVPFGQHWTVVPVVSAQQGPLQQTMLVVPVLFAAQRAVVASHVPLQQTLPEAQQVPGVPQQLAPTSQHVPLQQT
jgi:hypothetical protein